MKMTGFRTRTVFADRKLAVIVVASGELRAGRTQQTCGLLGSVKPIAVVVRGVDGSHAVDMDAKALDIDQLTAQVPELRSALY